jgi:hypothetical protein
VPDLVRLAFEWGRSNMEASVANNAALSPDTPSAVCCVQTKICFS